MLDQNGLQIRKEQEKLHQNTRRHAARIFRDPEKNSGKLKLSGKPVCDVINLFLFLFLCKFFMQFFYYANFYDNFSYFCYNVVCYLCIRICVMYMCVLYVR